MKLNTFLNSKRPQIKVTMPKEKEINVESADLNKFFNYSNNQFEKMVNEIKNSSYELHTSPVSEQYIKGYEDAIANICNMMNNRG